MKVIAAALFWVFLFLAWPVSASAQGDITAPALVDLQIEPQVVDTTDSSQTITFTAHITDDLSGFDSAHVDFRPIAGTTQYLSAGFGENERVSGTALDGVYVTSRGLPQYAAEGRWRLRSANTRDEVGNWDGTVYDHDDWPERFNTYYFVNVEDNMRLLYLPAVFR